MKSKSRVDYAIKNVSVGTIMQLITIILSFVSRTIFVKLLGNDYLSCDGLFSNILTLLSFSELGIGSAIIYSLYKPIAENNKEKIGELMNLFKNAYRFIIITILIIGLAILPFLNLLINDVPNIKESIQILYILFLVDTVSTYVFGYKRSFLIANQENYIVLIVQQICKIIRVLIQMIILFVFHNYIVYLLISIVFNLLSNIICTLIVDKKYAFIDENIHKKLSKKEKKEIFVKIKSIIYYKFGSVILNGTDNIIISAFLKTSLIGVCSNYNLLITTVKQVVNQALGGLQASIGNHNVMTNKENRYETFQILFFISFWIFGFFTLSLLNLSTPFIHLWLGEKYELPYDVVFALVMTFYVLTINSVPSMYRSSMGYFEETKMFPFYGAIINIVLSILFAKIFGLSGVFIATIITRILTFNIIDAYFVYKKGFERKVFDFYILNIKYLLILAVAYVISKLSLNTFSVITPISFVLMTICNTIVVNTVFFLFLFRKKEFKYIISIVKNKLRGGK